MFVRVLLWGMSLFSLFFANTPSFSPHNSPLLLLSTRYDKRTNKAQKPIKYAKSTTQSHHHLPQGQSSSSAGGYTIGHADLAAAFAEQDALSNAAGFHHLHQHQQMHNPQVCICVCVFDVHRWVCH